MEASRIPIRRLPVAPPAAVVRGRARGGLLAGLFALVLAAGALPAVAFAAVVPGLYEGTVPGELSDTGRAAAAAEALRQVVVKVTGRRAAATEAALAPLFADAVRYVQTFRPAAGGQVTVGFDADALDGALIRAGLPLWSRDRPSTLVVLVVDRPGQPRAVVGGVEAEERRAIDRAAQLRGLPVVWPGPLDAATAQSLAEDVLANRGDALLEYAQRHEAAGVLYGRAGAAGVQWTWALPSGPGSLAGAAADGVNAVADRYAASLTSGQTGAIALLPIVVTGTRSLRDYVDVTAALEAIPNVRGVQLERAGAEELTFRVNFRGDVDALRRAVAAGGRLVPQEGEGAAVRFALQP